MENHGNRIKLVTNNKPQKEATIEIHPYGKIVYDIKKDSISLKSSEINDAKRFVKDHMKILIQYYNHKIDTVTLMQYFDNNL